MNWDPVAGCIFCNLKVKSDSAGTNELLFAVYDKYPVNCGYTLLPSTATFATCAI